MFNNSPLNMVFENTVRISSIKSFIKAGKVIIHTLYSPPTSTLELSVNLLNLIITMRKPNFNKLPPTRRPESTRRKLPNQKVENPLSKGPQPLPRNYLLILGCKAESKTFSPITSQRGRATLGCNVSSNVAVMQDIITIIHFKSFSLSTAKQSLSTVDTLIAF